MCGVGVCECRVSVCVHNKVLLFLFNLSRVCIILSPIVSIVDHVITTQERRPDMPLARFVIHLDADAAQLRLQRVGLLKFARLLGRKPLA